ncbi:hypothetical protein I317_00712 [Kwoniella heveanensis CBS 569]|nr:hypothetical protein I317_00712 [Kwoniella heveanensis CBS 569]
MSRALLITGATGKQGGALINYLLQSSAAHPRSSPATKEFTILALTRDPTSASARALAAKSPSIKLIKGDLDAVPSVFAAAKAASPSHSIWGVYSVQAYNGKVSEHSPETAQEVKQGIALIDQAIKEGVQHFVYSSVDRGGEDRSWENPTPIPHFRTKHLIEHHLREATTSKDGAAATTTMGWTILRPVAFMDNLSPGFFGKVLLTSMRDTLKGRPLQWVSTSDIGYFGAEAFRDPTKWNHKAISIAGDSLTFDQLNQAFKNATGGDPAGTTYGFFGSALRAGVKDVRLMLDWFRDEGYNADIDKLRELKPDLMDMETWIKKKSAFVKRE